MTSSPRQSSRVLPVAVALGVAYAVLYTVIDVSSDFGSTIGSPFWPAAGVTVVVLLLRPYRDWPVLLGVVMGVETLLDVRAGFGVPVSVAMGLANTAEPLLAATLLRRGGREAPDLRRKDGLGRFLLYAVIAGPLLGASIGTFGPALVAGDAILPRLPRWFVGDAVGVLVIAPAVDAVLRGRTDRSMVLPLLAVSVSAALVLGPLRAPAEVGLPFLVLPALAFVALRLGPGGAALGVLIVATIVEATAVSGTGPFAHEGPFGGLVVVQMFLAMASLTSLTVSTLADDLVSREELERTLREQALHDHLTGLANRRLLLDRLERANLRLARAEAPVAVLYLDLDGFKKINDRWGHDIGDLVLRTTAQRLVAHVRAEDTVARLGGDEFVVLAEGLTDEHHARELADRIVAACAEPILHAGGVLRMGVSVGVCVALSPVASAARLLSVADRAMYIAKHAGGGRVRLEHAPSVA